MKILIVHKNRKCNIDSQLSQIFPKQNIKTAWKNTLEKSDFKNTDLVISVGGDGTFLSASHFIEKQPILGVNANISKSEGALTSIQLEKLEKKLHNIIKLKKYKIKQYQREKIIIYPTNKKQIQTEFALNETYIGNLNPHHPSNYIIQTPKKQEQQRSSGVLTSTGTGSTAWYKTMGGKPFKRTKKQLRFKIRELYSRRLHKPKIKKGKINQNQKLTIISKMNHGIVSIDSIRTYQIKQNSKIEISLGPYLNVIQ